MDFLKGIDLSDPWRVLECYWTDGRYKIFKNYMIDIFGNVKNKDGLFLSMRVTNGYERFRVFDNSDGYSISVHQAMCSSFYGKPLSGDTPDHINGNPKDNNVWNLRWAHKKLQRDNQVGNSRLRMDSCPIIATHKLTGKVLEFESMCDAEEVGFKSGKISECIKNGLKGKGRRTHDDYFWKTPEERPDLPGEIWRMWEKTTQQEKYISNHGRVGYKFNNGFFKKIDCRDLITTKAADAGFYPTVGKDKKHYYVHREVYILFKGDIPDDKIVNHIDHNKMNAHIDNLELTTQTENSLAAHNFGQFDDTKSKRKPVRIDGVEYKCCADAVRKLHPNITDTKDMNTIEARYRNRVKNCNNSNYIFI
jgi:hypothetical protein